MKVVVIGGTGRVGSQVVGMLAEQGHDAVAASPSTGVNTVTGEGVDDVLRGADVLVDVSNSPSFEETEATTFFENSTETLLTAEAAAGVRHHVALSVVGTEELAATSGYFRAKLLQERLIGKGSVPYTIIHATQFFEFLTDIIDTATQDGTVHVPPANMQPISTADVAKAVAHRAIGAPVNGIEEIGGPEKLRMAELFRATLAPLDDPREVLEDPEALYWGAKIGEDTLCPDEGATLSDTTLRQWQAVRN
jgi:uncharacterized protein YbjT (DUF2867 family)